MKTTRSRILWAVGILGVISTAQTVSAFYNPELGRWATRDPIGEQASINLYSFVLNDPLDLTDPDGLRSRIYGAGKLCVDAGCKPNACKAKYLDEDDWKKGWLDLPKPGGCVEADAVAFPSGILKIPDNCRITLMCEKDGSYNGKYKQTCYGLLRRPVWDPPGFPPNPFPQAKLVFGNVPQAK